MDEKYEQLRAALEAANEFGENCFVTVNSADIRALLAERDVLRKLLSSAADLLDDASKALDETEEACFTIVHETESMAEHIRAALAQEQGGSDAQD